MYEIDLLPVGDGEKSGDAITLRFSYPNSWNGDQVVCVVDGGFQDDGEALVDHINTYYGTGRVDLVVSTHPDADHINGLSVVLNNLTVGELWMHQAWRHSPVVAEAFAGRRVTDLTMREALREALERARDLESIAIERNIPITEPFAGESRFGERVTVVGPTLEFYESLLPALRGEGTVAATLAELLKEALAKAKTVLEALNIETLDDSGETTPGNNSSAILLLQLDGTRLLLTGDAGIPALSLAADSMDSMGLAGPLDFVQVPHHGSRRNVGPTILNRLLGHYPQDPRMSAFVSASKDAKKHPSKQVTNAFRRRGAPVCSTEGRKILHRSSDAPNRSDYGPIEPLPLFTTIEVEE